MNTLICPLTTFSQALFYLAGHLDNELYLTVGYRMQPPVQEWLVRELVHHLPQVPFFSLRLRAGVRGLTLLPTWLTTALPAQQGWLFLGASAWRGSVWGRVRLEQTPAPLQHLLLVGAGMHRVPVNDPYPE
jgi:hypothetical protein